MEILLFVVFSLAFLTAGVALFRPRHLVFVVFLFMNWIVFLLVPFIRYNLDAATYGEGLPWPWVVVFGGFFLPLFLLYLYFSDRGRTRWSAGQAEVRPRGALVYSLASFLFAAAFVVVAVTNGLVFMRIGHPALARSIMSLGIMEHAILRLFIELLPLLLPANMLLFSILRLRLPEKLLLAGFLLVGWLQILLNSRADALVVILVYFILHVAVESSGRNLIGRSLKFGILVVLLVILVSFGRSIYLGSRSGEGTDLGTVFVEGQWLDRTDGMSMICDIHHGAAGQGFMWGAAWENAIMLNYYFLFDKAKYNEIKLGLKTNPKVLISEKYRGQEVADTPASFLADLYANFSVGGLLLGALVFAYVLSSAVRQIRGSRLGSVAFFVAVWVVIRALYVENEFLSMIIIFIKFLPLVVVFALIYPAKAVPQGRALPADGVAAGTDGRDGVVG